MGRSGFSRILSCTARVRPEGRDARPPQVTPMCMHTLEFQAGGPQPPGNGWKVLPDFKGFSALREKRLRAAGTGAAERSAGGQQRCCSSLAEPALLSHSPGNPRHDQTGQADTAILGERSAWHGQGQELRHKPKAVMLPVAMG